MSYWVYLQDEEGNTLEVDVHSEGGTHVIGGTGFAELNVTYNYGWFYHRVLGKGGLQSLDSKKACHVTQGLAKAVGELGVNRYEKDYWAATPGNAGHALSILLKWALQYPNGIFHIKP